MHSSYASLISPINVQLCSVSNVSSLLWCLVFLWLKANVAFCLFDDKQRIGVSVLYVSAANTKCTKWMTIKFECNRGWMYERMKDVIKSQRNRKKRNGHLTQFCEYKCRLPTVITLSCCKIHIRKKKIPNKTRELWQFSPITIIIIQKGIVIEC